MCRSHRMGQTRPVHVYRLISANSMEEEIFDLQMRKIGLSSRIVDEKAMKQFSNRDLEHFFEPPGPWIDTLQVVDTEDPVLSKLPLEWARIA